MKVHTNNTKNNSKKIPTESLLITRSIAWAKQQMREEDEKQRKSKGGN